MGSNDWIRYSYNGCVSLPLHNIHRPSRSDIPRFFGPTIRNKRLFFLLREDSRWFSSSSNKIQEQLIPISPIPANLTHAQWSRQWFSTEVESWALSKHRWSIQLGISCLPLFQLACSRTHSRSVQCNYQRHYSIRFSICSTAWRRKQVVVA